MLESWLTISPLAVNLVIALPKSPMSSMFCSKSFSELSSELSSDEGLSLSKSPPSDSSELSEIFANSARYSSNKKCIFVRSAPDKFRSFALLRLCCHFELNKFRMRKSNRFQQKQPRKYR